MATAPSTEPQREIWAACALGDDASLAFNESITIKLQGPIEASLLRAALSDLVARHEALRTTFSGDGLTLCIGATFEAELTQHDLSALSAEAARAELGALAKREVSAPFDLGQGPLFRAHFAQLPAAEHALIFTAHHIVCDGWSTAVLVRDWAAHYNARAKGEEPALPPAESLAEYARQRAEATTAQREADEQYWLKQFSREAAALDLPTDRPRPPRKTYRASREDAVLSAELVSAVRKAGGRERASLFATLLAAFKALVFRLSAQEDLVIGIPAAGQASEGHANLVGHCVNMLPLRSALRADEPFSALLGRVRKTLLDAQEHQDFTFGTLLTKLPIARDPSRLPLVSVIFNVDRGMTSEAIGFDNASAELKANPRTYENFDLFLNAVEISGQVELECQYNEDLFDAATIRRWLESYRLLLGDIAQNPHTAVGALALLSEADRLQLSAWNATDATFDRDACVHDLVEATARRTPTRLACQFEANSLTYGELDARANHLAAKLRSLGARRGALVGVCLERGLDLLVSLLAVLKAGAAYVPLDPGYPKDRLAFMVQDSAMQVLLTDSKLHAELGFEVAQVVCVDGPGESANGQGSMALPKDGDSGTPADPAYVIYTSGSTGKPKGVLVPHRAVVNLLGSVAKVPGLSDSDTVLAITTLSFDIAVSEIWLPLVVGAKIVMVSRDVAADGALLREVCERNQVTFIDATPATYRLLLSAGWRGGPELTLICTGEAMPKDLALELPRHAKSVWNGYGPTETTVWSTFWQVPPEAIRVLIGRPIDNTQIYVLDAQQGMVPIGVPGELYIGGSGVSLGYLNRPDLTRERFVPDPFAGSGSLMYRTGDVGRYLNSGELECLGRNDNQVKLRGFRIELGEIEDALARHDEVQQAAVILREDRPGDVRLVGYVVPRGEQAPKGSTLRAHLQKSLPDYMVPAIYVPLPRMPLTPSGKVDRRALPAPEADASAASADFVEPKTDTERLLAELWAGALNVARVSVNDDFFALGGHSLLASQILARLRRDHGIELSFRRFFEAPTVAGLAALIDGAPVAERDSGPAIRPRSAGVAAPLSLAQERLWLLEEMHPAQKLVHNLPAAWRLTGPVDAELLQRSLDAIVARHEVLRTALKLDGNTATQHVVESLTIPIAQHDLTTLPSEQREAAMLGKVRELTAELFDLTSAPLFRSALFRLGETEHVYFSVRHNIIWDGWSFDIFLRELCTAYSAFASGAQPEWRALPISYGDFALWQREWVKGSALSRQIAFWQSRLSGSVPDLSLPLDRPRPSQTTHAGGNTSLVISRDDADALTLVARRAGTTLFNIMFAAYTVVLHRYSGQREIVVGTPVRARNQPEVEELIGPFINAVVLRAELDPAESFLEYLARVRDLTLDAFSHQDMPLELLGTRPPIVRAFFSFQDAKSRPRMLGEATVTQLDVEPPAAANDLMLWLMDRPHELVAVANFSTEVFEPETVKRLLRSFVTLVRDISANPERRIGELSTLAPQDRAALEAVCSRVNPTAAAATSEALFARTGEAPAEVTFRDGQEQLTYAELETRARRVAGALTERAGPGHLVALDLPPGLDAITLASGALLAGCQVLPISASAPEPYRLRLLQASKPSLVVAGTEDQRALLSASTSAPVVAASELLGSAGTGIIPQPSPRSAAWLALMLGGDGAPTATSTTYAELADRVASLDRLLGSPGHAKLLAWAEPSAECFPLSLLLGARTKGSCEFVRDEAAVEAALTRALEQDAELCVLLPASLWWDILGSGFAGSKQLTALVHGRVSAELLDRLRAGMKRVVLLQEIFTPTSLAFGHVVGPHDPPSVLGQPLGGVRVSVLDGSLTEVALGAVGELCIEDSEPRRTGHWGRRRVDGSIELLSGALDSAVIGGARFLPVDVEHELSKHSAVSKALVRVVSERGRPRLVAYFVASQGADSTATELRRHLRAVLPEPMIPNLFLEVPSLPQKPDGTVDLERLPQAFSSTGLEEYVPPRTDVERVLVELYAEALQLPRVSIYDNFFDLGGHSLLCFRVIERIEKRLGKRPSPRAILLGSLEQVAAGLGDVQATPAQAGSSSERAAPPPDTSVSGRLLKKLTGLLRR